MPILASSTKVWDDAWFQGEAGHAGDSAIDAWRGVESQSEIATWHLVDSSAEHEALEAMLEGSKPQLPPGCVGLHYLLSTPFRYTSPYPSRFRRPYEAGIWYGADSVETVCAEMAYWRHRFLLDSAGLAKSNDGILTLHTLFKAHVDGKVLSLVDPPWSGAREHWTHGSNYEATHAVANAAREHGVDWIRYESVRSTGALCAAVLNPRALATKAPSDFQDWVCRTTRGQVVLAMRPNGQTFSWDF